MTREATVKAGDRDIARCLFRRARRGFESSLGREVRGKRIVDFLCGI
jgi:hypothetical protein